MRALVALVLLTTACASSEIGRYARHSTLSGDSGQMLSELGQLISRSQIPLSHVPEAWVQADRVLKRLTNGASLTRQYRVGVLAMGLPNAFSLPGGAIYVTEGLLWRLQDDEALAGVLGHEIAHVEMQHTARRIDRAVWDVSFGLVGSFFDQQEELESDVFATDLLKRAGYGVQGFSRFFELMQRLERHGEVPPGGFLMSHPPTQLRIDRLAAKPQAQSRAVAEDWSEMKRALRRVRFGISGSKLPEGRAWSAHLWFEPLDAAFLKRIFDAEAGVPVDLGLKLSESRLLFLRWLWLQNQGTEPEWREFLKSELEPRAKEREWARLLLEESEPERASVAPVPEGCASRIECAASQFAWHRLLSKDDNETLKWADAVVADWKALSAERRQHAFVRLWREDALLFQTVFNLNRPVRLRERSKLDASNGVTDEDLEQSARLKDAQVVEWHWHHAEKTWGYDRSGVEVVAAPWGFALQGPSGWSGIGALGIGMGYVWPRFRIGVDGQFFLLTASGFRLGQGQSASISGELLILQSADERWEWSLGPALGWTSHPSSLNVMSTELRMTTSLNFRLNSVAASRQYYLSLRGFGGGMFQNAGFFVSSGAALQIAARFGGSPATAESEGFSAPPEFF